MRVNLAVGIVARALGEYATPTRSRSISAAIMLSRRVLARSPRGRRVLLGIGDLERRRRLSGLPTGVELWHPYFAYPRSLLLAQ